MAGSTQGFGQQNGNAYNGSTPFAEVKKWEFTPTQKTSRVVTSATGGFEGAIMGGIGGYGSVTLVIPKTGWQTPPQFGTTPVLNLYADAARQHGYEQVPVAVKTNTVKIDLSSADGVELAFDFIANGPYNAIGAFAVLGALNDQSTSSSGA